MSTSTPVSTSNLVGSGEIRKLYGLSRVQVKRLVASGDLPEPLARLQSGNVWDTVAVALAVERLRKSGRLSAGGLIVPKQYLDKGAAA